jgi:hypothetical protein
MGELMEKENSEGLTLKILEKVKSDLIDTQALCSDYLIEEKLHKIINFIDQETYSSKVIFEEMIYRKVKETRNINAELNTDFYLLYRKFRENKISMQEAQTIYEMYLKEL